MPAASVASIVAVAAVVDQPFAPALPGVSVIVTSGLVVSAVAVQVNSSTTVAPLLSLAVTSTVPVPASEGVYDQLHDPSAFGVSVPGSLARLVMVRVSPASASANFPLAVCSWSSTLLVSTAGVAMVGAELAAVAVQVNSSTMVAPLWSLAVTWMVPEPASEGVYDQLHDPSAFGVSVPGSPARFVMVRVSAPWASANFPLAVCSWSSTLLVSTAAVAMVGAELAVAVQVNSSTTVAPLLSLAVTSTVPEPTSEGVYDQLHDPSAFGVSVPGSLARFVMVSVSPASASANFPLAVCARPSALLVSTAARATVGAAFAAVAVQVNSSVTFAP